MAIYNKILAAFCTLVLLQIEYALDNLVIVRGV